MATTTEAELIRIVRAVARLQAQRRKLRRQLKAIEKDLRIERKHQRAIVQELEQRRPDVAPMRLFAGAVGMTPGKD